MIKNCLTLGGFFAVQDLYNYSWWVGCGGKQFRPRSLVHRHHGTRVLNPGRLNSILNPSEADKLSSTVWFWKAHWWYYSVLLILWLLERPQIHLGILTWTSVRQFKGKRILSTMDSYKEMLFYLQPHMLKTLTFNKT